jgi:hypothetical protein
MGIKPGDLIVYELQGKSKEVSQCSMSANSQQKSR